MVHPFQGPFSYTKNVIDNWNSSAIGVYYCGYKTADGKLIVLYIGKGCSNGGIKCRLQDHLRDDYWPEVTHFGYHLCDTSFEADKHEIAEIALYKPRYNTIGVNN